MKPGSALAVGLAASVRVADAGVGDLFDLRREEPDFARPKLVEHLLLRPENADALDRLHGARRHQFDFLALLQEAIDHPHQHDDAEIGVVPTINQQGLKGCIDIALGRRQAGDDGFEHQIDANARFCRGEHGLRGVQADDVLDLLLYTLRLGGRQVDLVEDRYDLVLVVERLINIRQGLRLDTLRRVDHQQRTLASRQRAGDFVGEVDVARRVH